MKKTRPVLMSAAAAALLVLALPLGARELAGVTMPDTLAVGGQTLKLNGVGLRKKAIFKVYVGGLYLDTPSTDAAAILARDGAKAVRMQFLRNLRKTQLVDAFREGFDGNAPQKAAAQKTAVDRFLALIPDVKEGETLTLSYTPGKGTSVALGAKELGVVEGREFAEALFSIWLGPKPPSDSLKAAMLGG
jgi:hypothetical protein